MTTILPTDTTLYIDNDPGWYERKYDPPPLFDVDAYLRRLPTWAYTVAMTAFIAVDVTAGGAVIASVLSALN